MEIFYPSSQREAETVASVYDRRWLAATSRTLPAGDLPMRPVPLKCDGHSPTL